MAFKLDAATLMLADALLAFMAAGFSFVFASASLRVHEDAREWGWAMLALSGACFLWFLGPDAPMLSFFFGNALAVLAGVFVTRAFLCLSGSSPGRASFALLVLGMSGIVATYDFGAARSFTVISIALSHLAMVAIASWRLARCRNDLKLPYCRVMLAVLFVLGASILWRLWATLFGSGAVTVAPIASSGAQLTAIAAAGVLIVAGSFGFFGILSGRREQELLETARRDALTGLYTRGAFFELAQKAMEALQARSGNCSLLMIDLDHFKQINDTHGHAAGDAVLRHAARLVQWMIREQDIAGRYGGEELCVFLPGCGAQAARDIAERINAEAARQSVRLPGGGSISYTSSLGYVTHALRADGAAPTLDDLLHWADAALYQAKRLGRNRVHAAQQCEDEERFAATPAQ